MSENEHDQLIRLRERIKIFFEQVGSERELMYPAYQIDSPIGCEQQSISAVAWEFIEKTRKNLFDFSIVGNNSTETKL